jgi:hypothetical protein
MLNFLVKIESPMKKFILLPFFVLTLCMYAQTKKNESKQANNVNLSKFVIGKWETIQNSLTTNYLIIEFKKNKEFKYILRSSFRATYKLMNDSTLITKTLVPVFNKTITDTFKVNLKKDTLFITGKDSNQTVNYVFYRKNAGKSKDKGIAGYWYSPNYSDYPTDLTITNEGKYYISQILKTINGTYTIDGNHFIVNMGKTRLMDMKFQKFNNDIIVYGNGPNMRLKRVE